MKILAIDTASTVCSVAILENNKLFAHKTMDDEKTHSQKLMPLLQGLFSEMNLTLKEIDLFGVDIGPGSFTGIRIGMATIKAFCDVYQKPVCGISSLETLAYHAKDFCEDSLICSMIDAKHGNVYVGFFSYTNGIYVPIQEPQFDSMTHLLNSCQLFKKPIIFVGNASILFQDMIQSKLHEQAIFIPKIEKNKTHAFYVGLATYAHYQKNEFCDSNDLQPMYLKKSSAELQTKEKLNEFRNNGNE